MRLTASPWQILNQEDRSIKSADVHRTNINIYFRGNAARYIRGLSRTDPRLLIFARELNPDLQKFVTLSYASDPASAFLYCSTLK